MLTGAKEAAVGNDRERTSEQASDQPIDETIAGTGPGIADDSFAPGEDEPMEAPSDEEIEKIAKKLGAPTAQVDSLPLDGE